MGGYLTLAAVGPGMELAVGVPPLADLAESPASLFRRVDAAGFGGVVLGGLEEPDLPDIAAAVGETGLEPVAAHVPHDRLQAERTTVVRELRTLGCERTVVGPLHAAHFETDAEVARMATRLSALGGRLAADGRQLCYANRDHEFRSIEDEPAFGLLTERAGEGLAFAFDAGWAAVADRDPAAALGTIAGRTPLVTVTPRVSETGERRLPGKGPVDLSAVVEAAGEVDAEWLVHAADEPPLADEELAAAADAIAAASD